MPRARRIIKLRLPDKFIELCRRDAVAPETVLRGFIADLCEIVSWASAPRESGYSSNVTNPVPVARLGPGHGARSDNRTAP